MVRPRPSFLGRTAIAGVGYAPISRASGVSVLELATTAVRAAVADAGLARTDLDGVMSFQYMGDSTSAASVATALGLPRCGVLLDISLGGQAPCALVALAAAMVDSGQADYVAVFRALNGRSGRRVGRVRDDGPASALRYASGLVAYPQVVALWARRYLIETGATTDDLAAVAIAQRQWAAGNDRAMMRAPLEMADYLASPMVTDPFRMVDCTIEVDGAAAVLVTSLERARDLARPPVVISSAAYVATTGPGLDMADMTARADCSRNYTSDLADDLWRWAGFGPADVDIAEIYDCFSSTVLFGLEGLGFAERGGAGELVRSGATGPGGSLPTNTNGGLLCEGYLHGMNTVTEAVEQLQGRSESRQVDGAQAAVVTSGALTDGSALVLTADR